MSVRVCLCVLEQTTLDARLKSAYKQVKVFTEWEKIRSNAMESTVHHMLCKENVCLWLVKNESLWKSSSETAVMVSHFRLSSQHCWPLLIYFSVGQGITSDLFYSNFWKVHNVKTNRFSLIYWLKCWQQLYLIIMWIFILNCRKNKNSSLEFPLPAMLGYFLGDQ